MVIRFTGAVIVAVVLGFPSFYTDVSKYIDKDGRTHFVDSPEKIPQEYRTQAAEQAPLPPISRTKSGREKLYEQESYSSAAASAPKIEIFVTEWCPYCRNLEQFLKGEKLTYTRHDVEKSAKGRMLYEQLGGGGIPIVRIGGQVLRGFDEDEIRAALLEAR